MIPHSFHSLAKLSFFILNTCSSHISWPLVLTPLSGTFPKSFLIPDSLQCITPWKTCTWAAVTSNISLWKHPCFQITIQCWNHHNFVVIPGWLYVFLETLMFKANCYITGVQHSNPKEVVLGQPSRFYFVMVHIIVMVPNLCSTNLSSQIWKFWKGKVCYF